jgi:hypothetical protein
MKDIKSLDGSESDDNEMDEYNVPEQAQLHK